MVMKEDEALFARDMASREKDAEFAKACSEALAVHPECYAGGFSFGRSGESDIGILWKLDCLGELLRRPEAELAMPPGL